MIGSKLDINYGTEKPMSFPDDNIKAFKEVLDNYKHVDVLEWGAGRSTKYFTEYLTSKGISYTWDSLEVMRVWYKEVKSWNIPNVTINLVKADKSEYFKPPKKQYDVIFIDGTNRVECMKRATELLKPNGYVIVHDAERTDYHVGFKYYDYKIVGTKIQLMVGRLK